MMKNAFYFTVKVLFILKIYQFLCWLFSHIKKRLDKKDEVIMMSQPGKQIIATHILANISKIKGSQTMKFGQLIK